MQQKGVVLIAIAISVHTFVNYLPTGEGKMVSIKPKKIKLEAVHYGRACSRNRPVQRRERFKRLGRCRTELLLPAMVVVIHGVHCEVHFERSFNSGYVDMRMVGKFV